MAVKTRTDEVQKIRCAALELLMAAHPAADLKKVAEQVGIEKERLALYRKSVTPGPADTSNPFFDFDPAKCVLCGICVRTCDQVQGTHAIDFAFRGPQTVISPFGRAPFAESRCESCGECVARCPVGALSFKGFEVPERKVNTLCPYCGVGCGIELGLKGNKIVNVSGDRKNPVNRGALCVKGRFSLGFVNSPGRLTQPLVRGDDGDFHPVSWEKALSLVADRLKGIRDAHGGRALAGLASAKAANEENYLFQKFIRKEAGTNSVDHCARL
jgi:predicted molibdopterin-dependent oxidoreductase YjgC